MEDDQHVRSAGSDAREPVASAELEEDRILDGRTVVEDEIVLVAGAIVPRLQIPRLVHRGHRNRPLQGGRRHVSDVPFEGMVREIRDGQP